MGRCDVDVLGKIHHKAAAAKIEKGVVGMDELENKAM